jgi:hypothetical protein
VEQCHFGETSTVLGKQGVSSLLCNLKAQYRVPTTLNIEYLHVIHWFQLLILRNNHMKQCLLLNGCAVKIFLDKLWFSM